MAFYNWLKENIGLHPGKGYSLDRIDNDGNYEPGNLRWATPSEQQLNKRTYVNNKSGVKGVYWQDNCKKWGSTISIKGNNINLGVFKTIEVAIAARKEAEMLRDSLEPNLAIAWIDLYYKI